MVTGYVVTQDGARQITEAEKAYWVEVIGHVR